MSEGHQEFAASFEDIVTNAWHANQERANQLLLISQCWLAAGHLAAEERHAASDLAHSLKGSAGIFGHPDAARAALELERMFADDHLDCPAELDTLVHELRRCLQEDPRPDL